MPDLATLLCLLAILSCIPATCDAADLMGWRDLPALERARRPRAGAAAALRLSCYLVLIPTLVTLAAALSGGAAC
ncbi:hypothetical protein [Wenxinia saemankumensis]|uniref:Uncharacterized protein n=1 Tax=Wenxinia saemankumensis TaxID=1447782 RepID=A0A1M6EYM8_9RHOB|nr:hypothetical protein [Wenxinia saemankumensis]SHI90520.1 hypothetical protein SAMN05444417_2250 [Wenxinia saemankumensis]